MSQCTDQPSSGSRKGAAPAAQRKSVAASLNQSSRRCCCDSDSGSLHPARLDSSSRLCARASPVAAAADVTGGDAEKILD